MKTVSERLKGLLGSKDWRRYRGVGFEVKLINHFAVRLIEADRYVDFTMEQLVDEPDGDVEIILEAGRLNGVSSARISAEEIPLTRERLGKGLLRLGIRPIFRATGRHSGRITRDEEAQKGRRARGR